ncbi:hypothetical protein [Planosporangium mesophilum]|uniref:Tetratricopeptide repeat protein n=1 Tax=Planosporangium mesophilum TaxID=689768 RepID=A0A8J3T9M1_9ACTN|nr:hypothetical protein [Planosporangium mesophilum]GII22768.1 hypothetical protein Pme01_23650 [Planosporangium mesophilum]
MTRSSTCSAARWPTRRGATDYLGDHQTKLTRSFHPKLWNQPDGDGPRHDEPTRQALAEAVALVEYGRSADARRTLVRIATNEPTMAETWLRTLITQLK